MSLQAFASTSKFIYRSPVARSLPTCCSAAVRHHSSHSSPPVFSPSGKTSADTQIPYGDQESASSAYLPRNPKSSVPAPKLDEDATRSTPLNLTAKQRKLLEEIIRVDQAGELGANYIYQGQHAVFKRGRDKRVADIVQAMWDGEKKHIATFDKLITQHDVRPTALYPIWKMAGFALGAGTALMGKRAAMACTEAVETVIGEHYNSQVQALMETFPKDHPSIPLLQKILAEFRDDELEHLDTAVANESQQTPGYALLSAIIAGGCRIAISTTEKV